MIEIKRLSDCSLTDVLDAWNNGFKGYFSQMTMTVDQFLKRMVQEGLSAPDSVIAFCDGTPAGIVLSGFRTVNGEVISYNGGTGVATEFRRTGVGKRMMEKVIEIYRKKGVSVATLEAISQNEPAVNLYETLGYVVSDKVAYLQQEGADPFNISPSNLYTYEQTVPERVSRLSFYRIDRPWQTQWQSAMNGEAVVVRSNNLEVGYATFRRIFHSNGTIATIVLHQLGTDQGFDDQDHLIRAILSNVFSSEINCKRLVINCSINDQPLMNLLGEAGFTTIVEQVWMKKTIKENRNSNAKSIEKV
ncbi:GNAT family N-acetyltransferase [Pseudalkalibacillus decolorationis]|uniref:GNAT family N-acetyltransferase n=1 Tax=Pseudalkalibacillus decolorationis TaxID=163879 RepID=UPI0021483E58|nr:GNAT family N-acetyltransferase [Pseudalkalibacillus decolorationis]